MKLAVTLRLEFITTVHVVSVPEHAPLHPAKALPFVADAVKLTVSPGWNTKAHCVGHEMPSGLLVTCPVPVPPKLTSRAELLRVKVALTTTTWSLPRVMEHGPVP